MDGWSLFWWAAGSAFVLYGLALGVLAVARRTSEKVARRTARYWRHELAITTWILATPGLVAAGYGVLIAIGLVLFPLGIAVGTIATRVSLGERSRMYALPLIFVGVVDVILLRAQVQWGEVELGTDWAPTLGVASYLGLATANAVRIFTRGLKNSRLRRASAPGPEVHRDSNPTPGAFTPPVDLYRATASRIG